MFSPSGYATALPVAAHDHWGHGPWIVLAILALVATVAVVIWLIRGAGSSRNAGSTGGPFTATEILDRRFAEGAISTEDYLERKETLTRKDG